MLFATGDKPTDDGVQALMVSTLAFILTLIRSRRSLGPVGPSPSANSFRRFPSASSLPRDKEQLASISCLRMTVRQIQPRQLQ
jgi:hypothetical protein